MRYKNIFTAITIAALMSSGVVTAEPNDLPAEVNADEIDYDVETGVITATGNVLLKHGADRATGARAMYNINTQEAYLLDNVIVVREDMRLTCDSLRNNGAGHMQADGNVNMIQNIVPSAEYPDGDTRTFRGDHIDYYPDDRGHVVIPNGGIVTSGDGNFTADQMEGWFDDEYYTGNGNVHVISPPREMEAGGDRIEYFAKDSGKAILTGNAWAIQRNNTMRGNRLTVYLADNKDLKIKPEKPQEIEEPTFDEAFKE